MKHTKRQLHVETRPDMFTMPEYGGDVFDRRDQWYGKKPRPQREMPDNIAPGNMIGGDKMQAIKNRFS